MLKLVDKWSLTGPPRIVNSLISQNYVQAGWNLGAVVKFARDFYLNDFYKRHVKNLLSTLLLDRVVDPLLNGTKWKK